MHVDFQRVDERVRIGLAYMAFRTGIWRLIACSTISTSLTWRLGPPWRGWLPRR